MIKRTIITIIVTILLLGSYTICSLAYHPPPPPIMPTNIPTQTKTRSVPTPNVTKPIQYRSYLPNICSDCW